MKHNDVVALGCKFLQQIFILHENNDTQPIVYLDETWINQKPFMEHCMIKLNKCVLKYRKTKESDLLLFMQDVPNTGLHKIRNWFSVVILVLHRFP